jgi:hypothetical protein
LIVSACFYPRERQAQDESRWLQYGRKTHADPSTDYEVCASTILPLFFQTLIGYDATHSGLAFSPRGIGSIAGAIIAGTFASKMVARKLIAAGFAIFAIGSIWNGLFTVGICP